MPKIKLTEKSLAALPHLHAGREQETYYDETLTGFAVDVGRKCRTFVVRTRSAGRKVKVVIGRVGAIRPDGLAWTVTLARKRAQELLGQAAAGMLGQDGTAEQERATGPTLRDGLEIHVTAMQRKRRSPRSIAQIQDEVQRYLTAWLDLPLADLSPVELDAACNAIMASRAPVEGAVNPPGAATAKRLLAHVSAIWASTEKLHDLPGRNPAKRVTAHALLPRQERVPDGDLPAWLARVEKLSPVRRDLHLFCLFSGLRSESARSLRWEDVDYERALLHVRKAKGDKPYTIPVAATHIEILLRRARENVPEFGPWGGDHGWVFPGLDRTRRHVQPVVSDRPWRRTEEGKMPGLHALRRTYNSVAQEIGISLEDREALMNHNGQGVNLRVYTVPQRWGYLAECQAKIEAALWERLGRVDRNNAAEVQSKKSRAHLRAIDGGKAG